MSDSENINAVSDEQSKEGGSEDPASENTSSIVYGREGDGEGGQLQASAIKKKMSKVKSRAVGPKSKSRMTINRKNNSDTVRKVLEVEPIVAPAAVTLGRLKDEYYHDLRFALVPSAADRQIEGWSVDGRLREMRDAIDEIDRTLDGANLTLFGCSCTCPGAPSAPGCCCGGADGMTECARSATFSDSRPKLRTGVEMKSYRLIRSNGDRV